MRALVIASLLAATSFAAPAARAAEVCHTVVENGQFGTSRICVTSVLAPQGDNKYGPDQIGSDKGAWCEGAAGPGIGEQITEHMKPAGYFRTIHIINGYAKSEESFRRNGRIKRARIETDRGFRRDVTLKDTLTQQAVVIPNARALWVRLTILDVYPGKQGTDTCLSYFGVNLEELNN